MAMRSLGKVTVASAGTPVQATTNQAVPGARLGCQVVHVQAISGTGNIYVGASTLNKGTLADVWAVLPVPGAGLIASYDFILRGTVAGFNAADFWIDADTNGNVAFVSIIEQ